MPATHKTKSNDSATPVLYFALELSQNRWKLAFSPARGQKCRFVSVLARDTTHLLRQIGMAKKRFGLPGETSVFSCYEAGRDGFWLHRFLDQHKVNNVVVDSSSIEVKRRARRAKSDSLDAASLVGLLIRYREGERKVWSTVNVPSHDDEDHRQLHRELDQLRSERTAHTNRIHGLLAAVGLEIAINRHLPRSLDMLRQWNGDPLAPRLKHRLLREFERIQFLAGQIQVLERQQIAQIRDDRTPHVAKVRALLGLKGVGRTSATILVYECFGWRRFANRRELAGMAGLTPTPYQSGESNHEQGISKAGNIYVRWIMVELAWSWLRYQPNSALSRWYLKRFGRGNRRQQRVGVVALARKLLIELWRYVEQGDTPKRAAVVDWQTKLRGAAEVRRCA